VAIVSAGAPAVGARSTTPVNVLIDGSAKGLTVPLGKQGGTVCDPQHWAQPGAKACTLGFAGTFTGRMTAYDTGADLGAVRGVYLGRLDVTKATHAPVCLETGGTFTYVLFDGRGRRLGSVTSTFDQGDSEVCQPTTGSTARTYFFRADPVSGTGIFSGVNGGNWLVTGAGSLVSQRSGVYRDTLVVSGQVDARI
jgi:hypothetical protein